jgi:PKD repeat protein
VEDHRLVILPPAGFDLGDADVDQTLFDGNEDGARHVAVGDVYLGAAPPDAEAVVVKSNSADGDDSHGSADEDGVTGWPAGHILVKGNQYALTITSSGPGYVSAWADWNWLDDLHHFETSSERLLNDQPINGTFTLNLTVPNDGRSGRSFMRFRLSSLPGVANKPAGGAPDGEVEDYYIDIQEPTCRIDFSADHTSGYVGLPSAIITFQSIIESSFANPGLRTFSWDFGDGQSDTQPNPVHTYTSAGTFTVTLTVHGECGEQSKTYQDLIHMNLVPLESVNLEYGAAGLPPARQRYDAEVWIGRISDIDQVWVDTDTIPDDGSENDGLEFGPLEPGSQAYVNISVSHTGVLAAWIDFNHDGDWQDAGEDIIPAQAIAGGVVRTFTFMVPASAQAGTEMWARFRYAGQEEGGPEVPVSAVASPSGYQDDYSGEVQDYYFRMTPVELATFVAMVNNGGVQLEWRTGSETENMGFLVYRADTEKGLYAQISSALIPGAGTSASAHSYRYSDNTAESGRTYYYKLADVDFNGRMTLHGPVKAVLATPEGYVLEQNYPNPFNPETRITFQMKAPGLATVSVFNLKGQKVRELINRDLGAGTHMVSWNGKDANGKVLPSGTYLYKLQVNDYEETKKMEFLK